MTTTEHKPSAIITAFLNANGVRLILRNKEGNDVADDTIGYEYLKGTLAGRVVRVELDEVNDQIEVITPDASHTLVRGNGKSYYCYLDSERPAALTMAQAVAKCSKGPKPAPAYAAEELPF